MFFVTLFLSVCSTGGDSVPWVMGCGLQNTHCKNKNLASYEMLRRATGLGGSFATT